MRLPDQPYVSSHIYDGKLIIRLSYPSTEFEPGPVKEAVLTDAEALSLFHTLVDLIGSVRVKRS